MAKSAPMTLRTVPSSCWARFSWIEKISSLIVMTRNAYGPPRVENCRVATTRQHNRVESILATACLLISPVLTRAVLRENRENMRYHGEREAKSVRLEFLAIHYENALVVFGQAADRALGSTPSTRYKRRASLVLTPGLSPLPPPHPYSPFVCRGQRATYATAAPSASSFKLDPTRPDDRNNESISRGRPSHDSPAPIDTHSGKLTIYTVSSLARSGNDGI